MGIDEKRKFLRFKNDTDVKIKMNDKICSYPMKDVSAGGFRIDYVEGFKLGQVLEVIIDLTCGEFVTKTKVKWQEEEQGIGFEFVEKENIS